MIQKRSCNDPEPKHEGKPCRTDSQGVETRNTNYDCNKQKCPRKFLV